MRFEVSSAAVADSRHQECTAYRHVAKFEYVCKVCPEAPKLPLGNFFAKRGAGAGSAACGTVHVHRCCGGAAVCSAAVRRLRIISKVVPTATTW